MFVMCVFVVLGFKLGCRVSPAGFFSSANYRCHSPAHVSLNKLL